MDNSFDDIKRAKFVQLISSLLEMQRITSGSSIKDSEGRIRRKAIGYIYGFIDAALRTIGQDMGDSTIGMPITYHVLNNLFPSHADECLEFLVTHIGKDEYVTIGVMTGGQQYLEYTKPEHKGTPMKFGMFLLEGDV